MVYISLQDSVILTPILIQIEYEFPIIYPFQRKATAMRGFKEELLFFRYDGQEDSQIHDEAPFPFIAFDWEMA